MEEGVKNMRLEERRVKRQQEKEIKEKDTHGAA